jgi:two-component system NtrC family sensor kinase
MKLLLIIFLLLIGNLAFAQNRQRADSLKHQLAIARQDTSRVLILAELCDTYRSTDSAQFFGQQALTLAQKINFPKGEIRALAFFGRVYLELGNLPKGFQMQLKAMQIAEDNQLEQSSALTLNQIGNLYTTLNDFAKAAGYYKRSLAVNKKYDNAIEASTDKMQIGRAFEEMNQLDSALFYEQQAYNEMIQRHKNGEINPLVYRNLGRIYSKSGNAPLAFEYIHKGLRLATKSNSLFVVTGMLIDMGRFYKRINQRDSSIHYAKRGLEAAQRISNKRLVLQASQLLAEVYEPTDTKEAFRYYKIATLAKDDLFGTSNLQAVQEIIAQDQERKKEAENAKIAYQNQLKQYGLLASLGVFLLIAFILYRTNKQQKKANTLLYHQKEEINRQRTKAEQALTDLKATQNQLIQSEKMASLGELTAGIAHEIQNPLNFVNNFSEVSTDLVSELEEEHQKTARDPELEMELLGDLKQNLTKITQHGQRASAIVKGMLEHSRTSTGRKEFTDLNALTAEYLRLAYHGFQAKDNGFACELVSDFDPGLSKLEVMPQEMGRVLLNLFNNAFYALREKQKTAPGDYPPRVTVSTIQTKNRVEIRILDNGMGIPEAVKQKIFQPFFTTKPTGQGTGLGLSLSYDIVVKGHGGEMLAESQDGQYTEMILFLPIRNDSLVNSGQ